jgi:hypothetical protein
MEAYAPVAVPDIEKARRAAYTREKGGDKMGWHLYTSRAREFFELGAEEAKRRGGEIGSEHVLYGLVAGATSTVCWSAALLQVSWCAWARPLNTFAKKSSDKEDGAPDGRRRTMF